jgi:hypothetical protein
MEPKDIDNPIAEEDFRSQIKRDKFNTHLKNRCLMAFEEILFNHNADAVTLPDDQIKIIRKLIKDLNP